MGQADRLLDVLVQLKRVRLQPPDGQLAPGEYVLLRQLEEGPAKSCRELSRRLGVKPAAVSGLLSRLEQRGYLTRGESRCDRRRIDIALTEAGRTALRKTADSVGRLSAFLTAQLGEEDAGQFITLANRVLEGIHRFQAERNQ